MKKLVTSFVLISVSLIANCQGNNNIKALIPGYESGDTIKIADFVKSQISLNNKEYYIVSFTLLFTDRNLDYEYISNSNKITDEMKNALSKIEFVPSKTNAIAIKDIIVQNSQNNKVKIENLVYKLKM